MTTLSISPAVGTDDGQSGTGTGYMTSAGAIQLGGYFGTANGWFRTPNVTIASGASISSCTLTGDKLTSAGTAELTLRFEKAANPTYPTSGTDYDGRTLTTASVNDTDSGTGAYTSPNLATPAQEVIDQGGWSSGNAQILYVKDNNSNGTHGGFENRIQLRSMEAAPATIPSINWTYTIVMNAALSVGTVTATGVATSTKKTAPLVVGTVTLTGLAPTTRKTVAAAVGQLTVSGVALTAQKTAAAATGQVTISGVVPAFFGVASLAVGQVTFAGVELSVRKVETLLVGEVEFGARPRKEIQEINFGGATFGNLFISCPGVFSFAVQSVTASAAQWQTAINNTATVTAITGGIRFTFDLSPNNNRDVAQISIDINTSDGTPTVTTVQQGRSYPLTVLKQAALPVGSVEMTGVTPTTAMACEIAIGSLAISGVAPTVANLTRLSVGMFTLSGVMPTTIHIAELAIGNIANVGIPFTVVVSGTPKFPGSGTFVSLRMTAVLASLCYTGTVESTRMTGEFQKGHN